MRQTKVKALRRYYKAHKLDITWRQIKKQFKTTDLSFLLLFLGYQGKAWHERNEIL